MGASNGCPGCLHKAWHSGLLSPSCSFVEFLVSSWSGAAVVPTPTSCLGLPCHPSASRGSPGHAFIITTDWDPLASASCMSWLRQCTLWHGGYKGYRSQEPWEPLSLVHGTHGTQTWEVLEKCCGSVIGTCPLVWVLCGCGLMPLHVPRT